ARCGRRLRLVVATTGEQHDRPHHGRDHDDGDERPVAPELATPSSVGAICGGLHRCSFLSDSGHVRRPDRAMACSVWPRYEAMTPGSCSTSSGAPAAMTCPWSIATIRS